MVRRCWLDLGFGTSLICLFVSEFADPMVGNCLSWWRFGLDAGGSGNGWSMGSVVHVSVRGRDLIIWSLSESGYSFFSLFRSDVSFWLFRGRVFLGVVLGVGLVVEWFSGRRFEARCGSEGWRGFGWCSWVWIWRGCIV